MKDLLMPDESRDALAFTGRAEPQPIVIPWDDVWIALSRAATCNYLRRALMEQAFADDGIHVMREGSHSRNTQPEADIWMDS